MKKLSLLLLTLIVCFFTACHKDIWAELENLDQRVTKLEELCKEMNTNITSLQTIVSVLQSNDFITGIVEIKKNGEVIGYTITFGKHDPITIYHGQDGKDGADGKDGQDGQNGSANAPVIGVAQDTDGVYYWTLNGEWILDDNGNKLPVSGKDGQNGTNGSNGQNGADGKDGQDGEDGKDGADGQDGKNGITPQLKIEDGYWYISYDNGATWTQLGKATGEDGKDGADGENGKDGKDGQDGDSMFQSVTQDENFVYFTLADGTMIKIAKSNGSGEDINPNDIIQFVDYNARFALIDLGVDTNNDEEISYAEAKNVSRLDFSSYKFKSFREFKYFTNVKAVSFYNTGVREIVFPENGIDSILDNAFQGVSLKNLTITDGTTYIGERAFYNSTVENLTLPNSITVIGEEAFVGSAIKSYVFPSTITSMPRGSFAKCNNLETFVFPENYDGDPFLFGECEVGNGVRYSTPPICVYWNVIEYNQSFNGANSYGKQSIWGLVAACSDSYGGAYAPTKTKSVVFGDKVTTIPNYLCAYMKGLTDITLSNSILKIGERAFLGCISLSSITIPDNVTNIGAYAFYNCTALTSITIGASVSEIGNYAFNGCSSLKYLYIKAYTPPLLGSSVIPNTIGIIYVPRASVDEYKALWSDYADKIVGYDFE